MPTQFNNAMQTIISVGTMLALEVLGRNGFSRSGGFNRLVASTPVCPSQARQRDCSRALFLMRCLYAVADTAA